MASTAYGAIGLHDRVGVVMVQRVGLDPQGGGNGDVGAAAAVALRLAVDNPIPDGRLRAAM